MSHKMIYSNYCRVLKNFEELTYEWFPNGPGAIRVRVADYGEMIFTYEKPKKWRFETIEQWLEYKQILKRLN